MTESRRDEHEHTETDVLDEELMPTYDPDATARLRDTRGELERLRRSIETHEDG